MSKPAADPVTSLGTLNLCTGGTQNVNARTEALAGAADPFWLRLLFDSHDAETVASYPDKWKVSTTSGTSGTLVRFSVSYNNALFPGTGVYARVYDGLSPSGSEPFSLGLYTLGTPDATNKIWTWDMSLLNITCSTGGVNHHVKVYKYFWGISTADGSVAFQAVPA